MKILFAVFTVSNNESNGHTYFLKYMTGGKKPYPYDIMQ